MGFAENYMEKVYKDSNKRLKYFEQYKKEILAATDLNNELRNKLMLVPKTYWDDFTKYLLNDPEYRNALNAANPDKEEKSNKKSTKKEKEEFDFSEWEDDEVITSNTKINEKFEQLKKEILQAYENGSSDEMKELNFKKTYEKNWKSLSSNQWDSFRDYCFENEKFRNYYLISYGEEKYNKIYSLIYGKIDIKIFEKYKHKILISYEGEEDFLRNDTFKRAYEENYQKIPEGKYRDDFRDFCFNDEKFRNYYLISFGEERFNRIYALVKENQNIKEKKSSNDEDSSDNFNFPSGTDNSEEDDDFNLDFETDENNSEDEEDNDFNLDFGTDENDSAYEEDDEKIKEEEELQKKKDELLNKKINEYKNECNNNFTEDRKLYGLNTDLLIDKITRNIRNHHSSDLKEYLKEYALNLEGEELTGNCEKTMAASCCATRIVEILEDLKTIFEDDDIALKHIDKCYNSLKQFAYDKKVLAEKLIQEELEKEKNKEPESSDEDDAFDFGEWDDDESDSKSEDDDEEFDWNDDDDEESSDELIRKINGMKIALSNHFNSDEYKDIDADQLIDAITNMIVQEQLSVIEDSLEDFLRKGKPGKDIESLQTALKYRHGYIVISTTCDNIGRIINNSKINSLNRKINTYYDKMFEANGQMLTAAINKIKTKQNWRKAGNVVGNILLAPLKAYVKMGDFLDEYNQRPEVQERRRQESIRYYCKFCGQEFRRAGDATYHPCFRKTEYDKALAKLEGTSPLTHHYCEIYEGGQKSEYECKICHKRAKTLYTLLNGEGPCVPKVMANNERYHKNTSPEILAISRHEPML